MPLPRIPTFEELLKKVRQPKVPELEDIDATQASELGFNLPPNWRLRRLGGVDSLISPRGLTLRDLKMDEGKLTDFQAFRGDKPVRLPQPIVEPPPVEPPTELQPLDTGRVIYRRPSPGGEPVPTAPVSLVRRAEESRKWLTFKLEELQDIPFEERLTEIRRQASEAGIVLPKEYQAPTPEQLGPIETLERFGETVIGAVKAPLFEVAGVPISAGDITALVAIGFGVYEGVRSLVPLFNQIKDKALQTALNTGLDRWIARMSRGIPPQQFKTVQNALYNFIAGNRTWLQQRATENMLARMGRGLNATQAASQAVEETIRQTEANFASLIPRATQTGALAFGGLPRPAPIIKTLATVVETNLLGTAQTQASKIGLDLEAVQGIAEGEYWVAISANPKIGDEYFKWLGKVTKTNEELNALAKTLGDRIVSQERGILRARRGRFLPFKDIQDANKFLATGDTSLIAKTITQRGEPWTPEQLAQARAGLEALPEAGVITPSPFPPYQPPRPFRPTRGRTEAQAEAKLEALMAKMTPEERATFQISLKPEAQVTPLVAAITPPADVTPAITPPTVPTPTVEPVAPAVPEVTLTADEVRALGNTIPSEYNDASFRLETRAITEFSPTDPFDVRATNYAEAIRRGEKLPPIVIEESGIVIDGNQRLGGYEQAGVKDIPVAVVSEVTPPAVEVAKPPVEVVKPKVVPDVAPPAEPIIPPAEPIAKGVIPSTQGMKDLGAKEKVRPARKVLTRIGQWRELFKPTQRAEVELHEEQIAKSKMFDKWQKLLGKDKARWALVSDEINKKGSVVGLTDNETRVVNEYRKWADEWADRKDLPQVKRIKDYMPHLFEQEATRQIKEEGGIDPVLVQMLSEKVTRKITDPFLKKRLGAVGWVKDPVAAARAYEAVSLKFAYYTPILNKIDTMLADPNIPQSVKNYLSGYSKRMTGELSEIDKSANVTIREFAEKIKNVPVLGNYFYPRMTQGNPMGMASYNLTGGLYGLFLGFKATSAIRNLSQHTLILGEVGAKHFADGIRLRFTKEGKAAMKKSLVLRSRKFAYTAGLDSSYINKWTDKFRETALHMFRLADRQNVSDAFLAGYSEAKELYPEVGEQVWIDRGDEVAADTQYLYTKMNSMSFSQSAPGRTMSMLTTWTENWMELMTKWIKRTPSQVYLEQERLTGKAPPTKNWSQTYKAIALYMTLVGLAFAFDDQTRLKIKEYTGIGSLRYLAGAVGGEFPAMEAVGSVASMVAGFLTGDERMLNSGLAEFKSTFTPGVVRQLSNVGSGEKDWSTLLFYLEGKDFHIKNLNDKWEKGWIKYPVFETPEDKADYIKTHPKHRGWSDTKIRNQWREDNPLLEAQMFVVSRFTTLSSDKARANVLRLIEEHKIDTELIDGYEKIFGVDTNAELKTFEDRIGNFEDLIAGEEPKYFTLSNYASEVNKLVKSSGRAKIQKEASPLTRGILEAQDTIEAYDALKDEDKKIQNEARRLWRRQYPESEAWMFLLGRVTSFQSFEGAEKARGLMERYDIPIDWLEFPKRTIRRTGRASVTPVSVFSGFGAARPRRATPTYPTFPKPRISTGISVKAPTVPGF